MLCINNDISDFLSFKASYEKLLKRFDLTKSNEDDTSYSENIENPVTTLANSIITKTISSLSMPPERLSPEEKIDIVQKLNDLGVFLLKGSVSEVADQLKISETTVYRYLNKK